MIKYFAVFDASRNAYCTDLVPCDDDVIALRWFYGFIKNSNYSLTCPKHQDLSLDCIGEWDSQDRGFCPVDYSLCDGSDDSILHAYNKAIDESCSLLESAADIPTIKPQTDGDYRRMIELSKRKVVKDE